jgi:hypothetical protein
VQTPLWQTIVKHRELFFPCRGMFVPTMVNSLARLGCNASSSLDHRKLALDMAALVMAWEAQAGRDAAALAQVRGRGWGVGMGVLGLGGCLAGLGLRRTPRPELGLGAGGCPGDCCNQRCNR